MRNAVWFHCFAGIAGDMALGSLVDAGAGLEAIDRELQKLNVTGWQLSQETVQRAGVRATRVLVDTDEPTNVVRTLPSIRDIITNAQLSPRVQQRALAVFGALAEAEGRMHGISPEEVHFHEVGAVDAIIDIVGTCVALEFLDIDEVFASSIATGTGTVQAAHGTLPNPAPAVIELLRGAPTHGTAQTVELTTPTGAAIVAALATSFGPMPTFDELRASGFGAGSRDLHGLPNCTQAVVGTLADTNHLFDEHGGQPVFQLDVNVDDLTGEAIAYTVTRLLEEGAHDAWITPILMKKGRPAYTVSTLADSATVAHIAQILAEETGSFGIRGRQLQRWPSQRSFDDEQGIAMKSAPHRTKAEFDDAARVARESKRPVRQVIADVEHSHTHPQTSSQEPSP